MHLRPVGYMVRIDLKTKGRCLKAGRDDGTKM